MPDRPLASRGFTDCARRPVYADPDGRQYVIGDDGERVYGTWLLEHDGADEPVIIERREG